MSTHPLHLRVFLSSPGDVTEERQAARQVLERFQRQPLLAGEVSIDTVGWDDPAAPVPLAAGETPQDTVNRLKHRPSECDLTVVILWSRLGTPPAHSPYRSGTESEFAEALGANREIWIYHRTEKPSIEIDDPDSDEKRRQWRAVQDFLRSFQNPDGSLKGAYNPYPSVAQFAELFEKHLGVFVRAKLDGERGNLAGYIYPFEPEKYLAEGFCGREEIFAGLEQFAATRPCGYFRVTAEAGLGKTTLAAAVARRYGAPVFFAGASGRVRPDQCLNQLSAELIRRFRLPYRDLPPRAGEDSYFFEKVLAEAAEAATGPLWLVVDGLDAADEAVGGRNTLLLPSRLPQGVFCFLTQRPGDWPLAADWETPIEDVRIAWDSPMQKEDVAAFLDRQLRRPEMERALGRLAPGSDPASFALRLRELSEGNFMYLRHLLADMASGDAALGQGIPRGLPRYYAVIWSHMESLTGLEQRSVYRRIIGRLAVTREPVTAGWLAEQCGYDATLVSDVLLTWQRFLRRERRGGVERWHILHRSFGDFLGRNLDLAPIHAEVAACYRQPSRWNVHEGYPSRHLTTHLRLARELPALSALVNDRAWYESQVLADTTGAAYETDLLQLGLLAAEIDAGEAAAERPARWLAEEVRVSLASATLKNLWMNIGSGVLLTLVESGVLSISQALVLAGKNPHADGVSLALINLAPHLPETLLPQAAQMARATEKPEAMLAIAEYSRGAAREALLEDALACATAMAGDDALKPGALRDVALRFEEPRRTGIRQEAVAAARAFEDPEERASGLAELLDDGPGSQALAEEAWALAGSIEDPERRAEQLTGILSHLPENRRSEAAATALAAALAIAGPVERSSALAALLSEIPDAVFDAALAAARKLADPKDRSDHLLTLAPHAEPALRATLIAEAREAAPTIPDPGSQAAVLAQIASLLPGEAASLIDEAVRVLADGIAPAERIPLLLSLPIPPGVDRDAVLAKAAAGARDLDSALARARALLKIARELPPDRMRQLGQEAARIPGGILAAGEMAEDVEGVELAGALASRLGPVERGPLVDEAMKIARTLEYPYSSARALASLVPVLDPPGRAEVVEAVAAIARRLEHPAERAELLAAMAPFLTGPDQSAAVMEAADAARSIRHGEVGLSGTFNSETGVVRLNPISSLSGNTPLALLRVAMAAPPDFRRQLIGEAFEFMCQIAGTQQAAILRDLAPHLAAAEIRHVVAGFRSILLDPVMQGFARWLAEPSGEAESAQPEAESSEENLVQFDLQAGDLFRLTLNPVPGAAVTFTPPDRFPTAEAEQQAQIGVLRAWAGTLSEEDREGWAKEAASLRIESEWPRAMAAVLERLAELESMDAALEAAHGIWGDELPPVVACWFALHVPRADRERLLGAAASERIAGAIEQLSGKWSYDDLSGYLLTVPRPHLLAVVQKALRETTDRQQLLKQIRETLPAMEILAGPEVAQPMGEALLQVFRWWS